MSLKVEIPAEGIRKENYDSYSLGCQCTDDDHAISIWFDREDDERLTDVEVTFYISSHTARGLNIFERIKGAFNLVFFGYTEMQQSIILSEQSAQNFAGLLLDKSQFKKTVI